MRDFHFVTDVKIVNGHMSTDLPLIVTVQGHIDSCETVRANNLYCRYRYSFGGDWSLPTGENEGVTQTGHLSAHNICVFGQPINVSFKGNKPHGWPQILVEIYGHNTLGNDVVIGNGAVHIPTRDGRYDLEVPLFVPASASLMQTIIGLFTGVSPTYINPEFIAGGADRGITKTVSQGKVTLSLNVLIRGMKALDLRA